MPGRLSTSVMSRSKPTTSGFRATSQGEGTCRESSIAPGRIALGARMSVTLADHLRALPDHELAALVTLRPDLVVPVPADLSALAVRAQSRLSVARALDGLDRFTLEILDALRLARGAADRSAAGGPATGGPVNGGGPATDGGTT